MNIINLFKNEKILFFYVFLVIIVIIMLIIFLYSFLSPSSNQENNLPSNITLTPIQQFELSPYLKTKIGKTTKKEVDNFSNIKKSVTLPDGSIKHSFESPVTLREIFIVVKDSVVVFENSNTVNTNYEHPKISEYISSYGSPEKEISGSKTYGKFEKFYIYSSKGFTIIGNPFTDEIDEIQAYLPISVENYINLWGSDINQNLESKENI